ncbi:hypothetical protein B0H14DRAFT_2638662 [Mycena olivaceomarginata]|nr:hypothetical protein B0H14DRAFT_2638662 [Mycena olivaceomarginata]
MAKKPRNVLNYTVSSMDENGTHLLKFFRNESSVIDCANLGGHFRPKPLGGNGRLLSCGGFLGEVEHDDVTFGMALYQPFHHSTSLHFSSFPPTIPSSLRCAQVNPTILLSTSVFPNIRNLTDSCSFHRLPWHILRWHFNSAQWFITCLFHFYIYPSPPPPSSLLPVAM